MKTDDHNQHHELTRQLYAMPTARIATLLARLQRVQQKARNAWRAQCPAHGGDNPTSLSIGEAEDGAILVHCFAHGCTAAEIVAAIGLELTDLFPDQPQRVSRPQRRRVVSETILHELRVVWVAAQQVAAGTALEPTDLQRLWVAIDLIEKLGKEL